MYFVFFNRLFPVSSELNDPGNRETGLDETGLPAKNSFIPT
jgi:hypothetical protein